MDLLTELYNNINLEFDRLLYYYHKYDDVMNELNDMFNIELHDLFNDPIYIEFFGNYEHNFINTFFYR